MEAKCPTGRASLDVSLGVEVGGWLQVVHTKGRSYNLSFPPPTLRKIVGGAHLATSGGRSFAIEGEHFGPSGIWVRCNTPHIARLASELAAARRARSPPRSRCSPPLPAHCDRVCESNTVTRTRTAPRALRVSAQRDVQFERCSGRTYRPAVLPNGLLRLAGRHDQLRDAKSNYSK